MGKKKRNNGFRNSTSKDGALTIKLDPYIAKIVKVFCADRNLNCGEFVNSAVLDAVAKISEENVDNFFSSMSKEEVIAAHKEIMAANDVFPFNYLAMKKERDEQRMKIQESADEGSEGLAHGDQVD